jgi:hypothetical protein
VAGGGEHHGRFRADPELSPSARPALRGAAAQQLGVAAPRHYLDAGPGQVQTPRHHVGHVLGDGMEPDHRAGGGRVQQPGGSQLHPVDPAGDLLLGTVGDVDQAGDHGNAAQRGRHPAGQVGLEQGGVDQVRAAAGDQPGGATDPSRPAAGPGQGVQRHTGRLELGLHAGALVEGGDLQAGTPSDQVRRHGGQGPLGASGHQAVDQVEHVHGTAPASGRHRPRARSHIVGHSAGP